jgi:hypothetical protein
MVPAAKAGPSQAGAPAKTEVRFNGKLGNSDPATVDFPFKVFAKGYMRGELTGCLILKAWLGKAASGDLVYV